MMKILVTGALGFVGLNLVRTLAAKRDVFVVAADVREPEPLERSFLAPVARSVGYETLDVTDRSALRVLVRDRAISHIVNGAAITPSEDQEKALNTRVVDVNVGGAINVLDVATTTPHVVRVLCLSSSGVYGIAGQVADGRLDENAPLVLDNLYAVTKRSVELLTTHYAALHGKALASVRLGPIYGPMERASLSRPRTSPPGRLLAAWRNKNPVSVYGAGVTRDWTFAGDVGEAMWALLTTPVLRHNVYNVSYGRPVSLQGIVDAFVKEGLTVSWAAQGEDAEIVMTPAATRTPMDGTRLQSDTGYTPDTSPEDGIMETVALERRLMQP